MTESECSLISPEYNNKKTHPSCNNSNRVVYQTQIRRATGDRPNNVDTTTQNAKRLHSTPPKPAIEDSHIANLRPHPPNTL